MQRTRFDAEKIIKSVKVLLKRGFYTPAFAEEGDSGDASTGNRQQINYEALIAQARQEEKSKLYPQIEKLKKDKEGLIEQVNGLLLERAELQKSLNEAKEAGKSKHTDEEVTQLNAQIEALQAEVKKLKEEAEKAPNEEAIREAIKKEYEVKDYLREQLSKNSDILSAFAGEVKGATKEEVDASILAAKEKSKKIREELGIKEDTKKKETDKKKEEESNNTKVKRPKLAFPSQNSEEEELTLDDVRNLDPNSEEYKKFRKKLGLK